MVPSRRLACLAGHVGFGLIQCWALIGLALSAACIRASDISLTRKTSVKFADALEAATELNRRDVFIESLSLFDRAARKKTDQTVSEEEFLKFVSAQALPWRETEIDKVTRVLRAIGKKIDRFHHHLPASIRLVKTTGLEEGRAAYCRGNNVFMPLNHVQDPERALERLLTHELFHILSRNNRELRDSLYAVLGFKPCGAIAYPEELAARKITNPDAPIVEHYITVTVQGKPAPVVPILFSKEENYDAQKGGEFFAYLTFKLLAVEQKANLWKPVEQDGKLSLLEVNEVEGFHEQIGQNTNYIIHPEEILADNFVLLVQGDKDARTPRILQEMRRILTTDRESK